MECDQYICLCLCIWIMPHFMSLWPDTKLQRDNILLYNQSMLQYCHLRALKVAHLKLTISRMYSVISV